MGFFTNHKKKSDKDLDIVALASGTMICPDQIKDAVFSQQMMGQTIGFILDSGEIVSPVTGKVEVMFPTGHAFMIRMKDGTGILVHVGINTVELNGKGFKVYVKQGQDVKAGQTVVRLDLKAVKQQGYDTTTMLIVSESINKTIPFIDFGKVKKGKSIVKKVYV